MENETTKAIPRDKSCSFYYLKKWFKESLNKYLDSAITTLERIISELKNTLVWDRKVDEEENIITVLKMLEEEFHIILKDEDIS